MSSQPPSSSNNTLAPEAIPLLGSPGPLSRLRTRTDEEIEALVQGIIGTIQSLADYDTANGTEGEGGFSVRLSIIPPMDMIFESSEPAEIERKVRETISGFDHEQLNEVEWLLVGDIFLDAAIDAARAATEFTPDQPVQWRQFTSDPSIHTTSDRLGQLLCHKVHTLLVGLENKFRVWLFPIDITVEPSEQQVTLESTDFTAIMRSLAPIFERSTQHDFSLLACRVTPLEGGYNAIPPFTGFPHGTSSYEHFDNMLYMLRNLHARFIDAEPAVINLQLEALEAHWRDQQAANAERYRRALGVEELPFEPPMRFPVPSKYKFSRSNDSEGIRPYH